MTRPVQYLTDEHVAKALAGGLEKRGIDALRVADAGLLGASDEELLAFASEEKRVVVTQDPDFLEIASRKSDHPGIVFLPQDRPLGEIVRLLDLLVQVSDAEEMQGRVEYI